MPPILLIVIGLVAAVAAAALFVADRQRRRRRAAPDALALLGVTRDQALAHLASAPLDLTKPIATEAHWQALHDHAADQAYRAALEQLRQRYRFAAPMLLPNTLRTAMEKWNCGFRDAVIEAAKDDALR